MAEQKNKSAEQLLSDLHQKRLEQALNEFNADKNKNGSRQIIRRIC